MWGENSSGRKVSLLNDRDHDHDHVHHDSPRSNKHYSSNSKSSSSSSIPVLSTFASYSSDTSSASADTASTSSSTNSAYSSASSASTSSSSRSERATTSNPLFKVHPRARAIKTNGPSRAESDESHHQSSSSIVSSTTTSLDLSSKPSRSPIISQQVSSLHHNHASPHIPSPSGVSNTNKDVAVTSSSSQRSISSTSSAHLHHSPTPSFPHLQAKRSTTAAHDRIHATHKQTHPDHTTSLSNPNAQSSTRASVAAQSPVSDGRSTSDPMNLNQAFNNMDSVYPYYPMSKVAAAPQHNLAYAHDFNASTYQPSSHFNPSSLQRLLPAGCMPISSSDQFAHATARPRDLSSSPTHSYFPSMNAMHDSIELMPDASQSMHHTSTLSPPALSPINPHTISTTSLRRRGQSSSVVRTHKSSPSSSSAGPLPLKKKFPCPHAQAFACGDTFTTSGHAARHGKKHTGEKNVRCPTCGKAFTRKDNMKQHERTHKTLGATRVPGQSSLSVAASSPHTNSMELDVKRDANVNAMDIDSGAVQMSMSSGDDGSDSAKRSSTSVPTLSSSSSFSLSPDPSATFPISPGQLPNTFVSVQTRPPLLRSELSEVLEQVQHAAEASMPVYGTAGVDGKLAVNMPPSFQHLDDSRVGLSARMPAIYKEGTSPGLDALASMAAAAGVPQ